MSPERSDGLWLPCTEGVGLVLVEGTRVTVLSPLGEEGAGVARTVPAAPTSVSELTELVHGVGAAPLPFGTVRWVVSSPSCSTRMDTRRAGVLG